MTEEFIPYAPDADLNADAIYAALVYLRNYAKSEKGEQDFRHLLDDKSETLNQMREMVPEGSTFKPIPKVNATPEFCETIYPGEPLSVETGMEAGRHVVYGPAGVAAALALDKGPIGEAVRRFIADDAN